jgi:hypothetical protein
MFLTPILLRAGKSATFIQVEGKTETNTALSATLVFGAPRQSSGQDYLLNFALPNFYFHVATAHDILRHNGVSIGKREYLGFGPE